MYGSKLTKIGRNSVPEFRPRKVNCGFFCERLHPNLFSPLPHVACRPKAILSTDSPIVSAQEYNVRDLISLVDFLPYCRSLFGVLVFLFVGYNMHYGF